MALRIRYQRAVGRAVASILRDLRKRLPLFDAMWLKLPDVEQRKCIDHWQGILERCLEFPDEDERKDVS